MSLIFPRQRRPRHRGVLCPSCRRIVDAVHAPPSGPVRTRVCVGCIPPLAVAS